MEHFVCLCLILDWLECVMFNTCMSKSYINSLSNQLSYNSFSHFHNLVHQFNTYQQRQVPITMFTGYSQEKLKQPDTTAWQVVRRVTHSDPLPLPQKQIPACIKQALTANFKSFPKQAYSQSTQLHYQLSERVFTQISRNATTMKVATSICCYRNKHSMFNVQYKPIVGVCLVEKQRQKRDFLQFK